MNMSAGDRDMFTFSSPSLYLLFLFLALLHWLPPVQHQIEPVRTEVLASLLGEKHLIFHFSFT